MTFGDVPFIPGRLTMARQARGILQKELADVVGRAAPTVSKWESSEYGQAPDAEAVAALSRALMVHPSWFYRTLPEASEAAFFRCMKSELLRMRELTAARLGFLRSLDDTLRDYVDFPDCDIPDLSTAMDFRQYRKEHIEHYAAALRDHWGLADDPITDLILLIENAGVIVGEDVFGSEKLDGISQWSTDGRPYILLAKDKDVGARRRFDAAHELGHLVLHRHVRPDHLREHFNLIEEQAMAFAGAFLMPASSFGDDLRSLSLDAMLEIKLKWKVSIAAMIKRLANLEEVSKEYERNLWKYYSHRRWRGFEPLDDEILVECPENLRSAIELLIDGGTLTRHQLLEQCGLSSDDVTQLSGLPNGFLDPAPHNVVRLKIPRRQDDSGNVVPLFGTKNT